MDVVEVVLIALVLVVALATLADRLDIPYPILLLLGGIALAFVPDLPRVSIDPDVLFLLFIPPLVFRAGWRISWRDFRATLAPTVLLATGLVLATIVVVAVVARFAIGDFSWNTAFVLGAVVSSTDPVAATVIAERLHLSSRIVTILEGESVGNDAASLVAYRSAVAATVTGIFILAPAVLEVVLAAVGGVAIGIVVALVYDWIERRLHNPPVEIVLMLVVPFAAYIPATQLDLSGVLAVLGAGMLLGRREPRTREADTRLEADAVWDSLVFALNGLIFVLLGLFLPGILAGVAGRPVGSLARDTAIIVATIIVVRFAWVFVLPYLPGPFRRLLQAPGVDPFPRRATVVAWAGMRGADTLVIALALPFATASGAPFPDRSLIIFLTFWVVAVTLLGQGLTLPPLIRRLGLHEDRSREREEALARVVADQAALARLAEILAQHDSQGDASNETPARNAGTDTAAGDWAEYLRHTYLHRARRNAARARGETDLAAEEDEEAARRIRRALVEAERQAIIQLRDRGEIGDAALREVLHDLDLEEERLA